LASGEHRRAWLLERVAILIGWAGDPLVRQVWVEEAASRLRVREDLLWDAIRGRSGGGKGARAPAGERTEGREPRLSTLERELIVLVVEQPEVFEDVADSVKLAPSVGPVVREILDWVAQLGRPPVAADIVRRLEARGVGGATAYLLNPPPGCASEGFRSDILRRLRQDVLQEELRRVNQRLKDLEAQEADPEALDDLLSAKQRLVRELDSLVRQ
jgi:hypothetical protein